MIIKKPKDLFLDLVNYLQNKLDIPRENLDFILISANPNHINKAITDEIYEYFIQDNILEINIERFGGTNQEVTTHLMSFLDSNDEYRELYEIQNPEVSSVSYDDQLVDVSIAVDLKEKIYLKKNLKGNIYLKGKRFEIVNEFSLNEAKAINFKVSTK